MIVVDLGCAQDPGSQSIPYLCSRFKPKLLLGFDPRCDDEIYFIGRTSVIVSGQAAWTRDGGVGFVEAGTSSGCTEAVADQTVDCFDICGLLGILPAPVVLKMDIESGEYELLPRIKELGLEDRISLLLVEWHGDPLELACPVERWLL